MNETCLKTTSQSNKQPLNQKEQGTIPHKKNSTRENLSPGEAKEEGDKNEK